MKNHTLATCLYALLLCLGIYSCQEQPSSSTEKTKSDQQSDIELLPGQIPYDTAKIRVDKYIEIYGETGMRHLTGSDSSTVILPRYFVVNADSIGNLMKNHNGRLFASLNVKPGYSGSEDLEISVTNLIFHKIPPNPDGSLKEVPDLFYDYSNACPIACGESSPSGGYNSEPVDSTEAVARINAYNNIYGQSDETVRYLKNATTQDSVLIPRYYSFSKTDIVDLLGAMEEYHHQLFFVSIGAVPLIENGQEVLNSYLSDLVFHYVQPGLGGHLSESGDVFFDVTRPCPDSCADLL